MSLNVVGVDLGSVYCRLAQITPQRKMPVILRNTLSNESTPCIVSYPEDGSRLYGEAALGKDLSRPQQTSTVLKLALNVNASDADAVNALRLTGAPVSVVDNHVVYNLGDKELAPAQVVGYFLRNVLTFATAAPDLVCLAAPVTSSAQYRNGLLDAAIVAGVPPHKVQVVDEADALAAYLHHLQYSDLPAAVEDAVRVLVLNCGESNTSVTLLSASQPKIDILASASIDVGVSVVDTVLADSVIAAIQKKHGEDMRTHPKSYNKIVRECKKAKVMLSTTEKVTVQFECLKSDIDHTMSFTVADLEAATSKYATAVAKLIESTANTAAVSLHEGHEVRVEVVGNGWRSPLISRCVKDACRVSRLGTSLDSNMCVAEGSAIFGVIAAAAEAAKAAVAATPPSEGAEAATPASPSTPATPAFDAVHSVEIVRRTGPPAPAPSADDVLAKWSETEAAFFAVDETHRLRVKALNDFETQVFRTKDAIAQACAGDANAQSALEAYIADQEKWIYDAQDGLIEDLSSATIVQRGADFDVYIYQNFPQMAAHWEKEAEKQRQKDEELAKLAKEQEADKEHKSDHQRLRGAQERREQGVNLFKQEHYEEAQTRFVQALTILGNIYDNTGDNKVKRDEIALSCHLNIASCCVKLGHWKIAVNNCTKALEIKPDHPKALFRRGQANAQLSEFESAKADLEKALELSAGDSAVVAELENVKARIADAKAREKKMFSKMFS